LGGLEGCRVRDGDGDGRGEGCFRWVQYIKCLFLLRRGTVGGFVLFMFVHMLGQRYSRSGLDG